MLTKHLCSVRAAIGLLLVLATSSAWSASEAYSELDGVVDPHPAPAWEISGWLNDYPGDLQDNRGKVIVIDFFQLWCPGCNTFTGPLMQQWQDRFATEIESGELLLVKIHTVFEGHDVQTVERLKLYLEEKGISLPVGIDKHLNGDYRPETKKRYKTSGTPEVVIIDREGMIRFQQFGWFEPVAVEAFIESLLGISGSSNRSEPLEICLSSELCGQG